MRQTLVLATALSLVLAFGCAKKAEKVAVDVPDEKLAGEVDDWKLTRDQLEDVLRRLPDAQKTKSGLASKVLSKGSGSAHPSAESTVKVNYTGWTTDGKMFDSSQKGGRPAQFRLDGVIPGWTEGLQLMTVGEKRRFWIPQELAYKGQPGSPQGMLVFDVELLEIAK